MTTVAVIGTSGTLGAPVLEALSNPVTGNFKYPIKAITTKDKTSTDKVQYIKKDIGDAELAKELAGTDVIISLLGVDPELFGKLENLLKQVKPKVYIPSEFGIDNDDSRKVFPTFFSAKVEHAANVEKIGGIKVVKIITSYFYFPPFLTDVVDHIGISKANNTLTLLGSADDKQVVYSTQKDIANTVVVVASTEPSKLKSLYHIHSDDVNILRFAAKFEKDNNVKLTVINKDKDAEIKAAKEDYATNGFDVSKFMEYIFIIFSSGVGYGISKPSYDNEAVNPGEKLWKWDKFQD